MSETNPKVAAPVVLKLGRQSAKKVKQLGKGEGPLVKRVMDAVSEMQRTGVVAAGAQPIIVVVKQESTSLFG